MKKCETCYYSHPAMNEELVVCSYMNDIISGEAKDLSNDVDLQTIKYFTDITNFSGDAYQAYVEIEGEPVLRLCVEKEASCGKWQHKHRD
jgi:hypothetical protein